MNDWKPIETAPKDGTWIIVWEPSEYPPDIWVVRWGEPEPYWPGRKKTWVTLGLGPNPDTYQPEATHWMPLPAPPSDDTLTEAGREKLG